LLLAKDIIKKRTKKSATPRPRGLGSKEQQEERLKSYEELHALGENRVKRHIKEGDKKWCDSEFLREKTCFVRRSLYKGGRRWKAPNCLAFWCCVTCRGAVRHIFDEHEKTCENCKNSEVRENIGFDGDGYEIVEY